jgi:hypothetical protein
VRTLPETQLHSGADSARAPDQEARKVVQRKIKQRSHLIATLYENISFDDELASAAAAQNSNEAPKLQAGVI